MDQPPPPSSPSIHNRQRPPAIVIPLLPTPSQPAKESVNASARTASATTPQHPSSIGDRNVLAIPASTQDALLDVSPHSSANYTLAPPSPDDGFLTCTSSENGSDSGSVTLTETERSWEKGDDEKEHPASMTDLSAMTLPKDTPLYKTIFVFTGLTLSLMLAALDMTIISTALPAIVGELGSLNEYSWIATSYMVTFTAFLPLCGKVSDIFGRRMVFLVSLAIFIVGSAGCGAATSFITLVFARAVQGLGSGGIINLAMIIANDIVSKEQRGMIQGIGGAFMGLSTLMGPLLGGIFSDKLSWRWIFYINLPLASVGFLCVYFFLDIPAPSGRLLWKLKRIDITGSFLIVVATTALLVALNWGGNTYTWNSWQVLLPLFLSILLYIAFILFEAPLSNDELQDDFTSESRKPTQQRSWIRLLVTGEYKKMIEPVIPVRQLFESINFSLCILASFLFSAALNAGIFYVPLHYQVVRADTAMQAGMRILPLCILVIISSVVSGFYVDRQRRMILMCQVGPVVTGLGTGLLLIWSEKSGWLTEIWAQIFMGIGVGMITQGLIMFVQTCLPSRLNATATTTHFFFRSIGACVGIAAVNTVLNNRWRIETENALGFSLTILLGNGEMNLKISDISTLPPILRDAVIQGFLKSIRWVWWGLTWLLIIEFIGSLFHKHTKSEEEEVKEGKERKEGREPACLVA
ncbi:hypothetical protein HDU97_000236 [Phlyctochytrium planicorne]|nr:hypothetical protein HDU97_000236 [Phlyctochytrium planicorne]